MVELSRLLERSSSRSAGSAMYKNVDQTIQDFIALVISSNAYSTVKQSSTQTKITEEGNLIKRYTNPYPPL
jgi:hypothetical protein